jgi:hypothetical protein
MENVLLMDQATLVLSALIIIILQIITLVTVLSVNRRFQAMDSSSRAPQGAPQGAPHERDRRDGAPQDRRPQQKKPLLPIGNPKTSAPQPQQPVALVDKTLRDINLRLKNAERNQERVRKQFNDGPRDPSTPRDTSSSRDPIAPRDPSSPRDPGRGSGNRYDRNDRGRGGRGSEHRRHDRNDRSDRSERDGQIPRNDAMHPATPADAVPPQQEPATLLPLTTAASGENGPIAPVVSDVQADQSEADVIHGRKVLVKRRSLKEENGLDEDSQADSTISAGSPIGETATASASESVPATPEEPRSESNPGTDEISFGRRF